MSGSPGIVDIQNVRGARGERQRERERKTRCVRRNEESSHVCVATTESSLSLSRFPLPPHLLSTSYYTLRFSSSS